MDLSYALYRGGSEVIRNMPKPVAEAFSEIFCSGAWAISGQRRMLVERHLERAYGKDLVGLSAQIAVRKAFMSYGRYWVDSFRLMDLSPQKINAGLSYEGFEHIQKARANGIGPLLVIPHLGGWEWAAFWLTTVAKIPVTAVVEPLEPPELFQFFVDYREKLGMNIVPLGPDAGKQITKAVQDRHVVCLLSDRDIQGTGIETMFFNEKTTLPGGPALLALRTGAPLLPAAIYFKGSQHYGVVNSPIPVERQGTLREDVSRITQSVAHELEKLIRVAPYQWHLQQPNWPSDYLALEKYGKIYERPKGWQNHVDPYFSGNE